MSGLPVPEGKPLPDTVTDIVKLIRQRGLNVAYEDPRENRALIAHKAADIWIPYYRKRNLFFCQFRVASSPR